MGGRWRRPLVSSTDDTDFRTTHRKGAAGITTAYAALSFWDHEGRETSRKQEVVRQMVAAIHTAEKVDLVAALGATLSEFPVTMEAAEEARRRGMLVAMGAPNALRGSSHSGNLSAREAVAAGVVDCLAADYHPGTMVQAAFGLVRAGVVSLPAAVALVTSGPADAIGMGDAGRSATGMRADLALVEEGACPRVRATVRNGTPIYWDNTMWGRQ